MLLGRALAGLSLVCLIMVGATLGRLSGPETRNDVKVEGGPTTEGPARPFEIENQGVAEPPATPGGEDTHLPVSGGGRPLDTASPPAYACQALHMQRLTLIRLASQVEDPEPESRKAAIDGLARYGSLFLAVTRESQGSRWTDGCAGVPDPMPDILESLGIAEELFEDEGDTNGVVLVQRARLEIVLGEEHGE